MRKVYKAIQPIGSRNIYALLRAVGDVPESVILVKDGRVANGKSMLGIMSLAIQSGDKVEIISRNSKIEGILSEYFTREM